MVAGAHPDAYSTLGLRPGASAAEVRGAYRRLVRTLHPDTGAAAAGSADRLAAVVSARRALEPRLREDAAAPRRHVDVYA